MKFDYPRPLYFAHQDYDVACGGNEIPMVAQDRKTYLYVFHKKDRRYEYYCFEDDRFYLEEEVAQLFAAY